MAAVKCNLPSKSADMQVGLKGNWTLSHFKSNIRSKLAACGPMSGFRIPFQLAFGNAFSRSSIVKALVVYEPNRISFSQIYPFLHFHQEFYEAYGVEFRYVPSYSLQKGLPSRYANATHILVQTWLTDPPDRLAVLCDKIVGLPHSPRLVYLDSFANSDVRLSKYLDEFSLYYKKSLFVERENYFLPTYGHTNLSEYYGRLFGIDQTTTDWGSPHSIQRRLRLAPNFLTDPTLMHRFMMQLPDTSVGRRDIDLHARLGGTGETNWYGAMRRKAEAQVANLKNLEVRAGIGISRMDFLDELQRSKLCFSPFGYGELCWRDIEAMALGAVVLKPDMSHLQTEPDLYRNNETYIAIRWDFADLEDRIRQLLADDDWRENIAHAAWETAQAYLKDAGPVRAYSDVFSDC